MRSKLVLLVDSDDDSRYVFASMLRHRGYEVREACDADAGLRLALEMRPDVVVAELRRHGTDGCSLVEALRLHAPTAQVLCLLVGTDPRPGARQRALRSGCHAYLLKPISPTELVDAVRRLDAAGAARTASGHFTPGPGAYARPGMPGSRPLGA